jgi:nitric oxide reductase large subunit
MPASTNHLSASWPARVGSRFELLANDDLGTTNWTAITGDIVALKTNVSVLLTTTNAAQRFLQVRRTQ